MAFKIVYGAGKTLERGGGFNTGYGFLAMHRDEAAQAFAYDVLEPRILGNRYHFDRGPHWGNAEKTVISSFQRCGGWHVLSRLRPTSERNGSVYYLAEFLLLSESEARELAAPSSAYGDADYAPVAPAVPVAPVVPAEILAADSLWHGGECWDQGPTWFDEEITVQELREAASGLAARSGAPVREAFAHPQCLWRVRPEAGERPQHALLSMAATQHALARHYGFRFPHDVGLFGVAWYRVSLTSFYLDPQAGLDLRFSEGDGSGELPCTWTAVFTGAQYHAELLASHPAAVVELDAPGATDVDARGESDDQEESAVPDIPELLGEEARLVAAGWIVRPAAPEPSVDVAAVTQAPSRDVSMTGNYPTTTLSSKSPAKAPSTGISGMQILGVLAIVLLLLSGLTALLVSSQRSTKRAIAAAASEIDYAAGGGNFAAVTRAFQEPHPKGVLENERFDVYRRALDALDALRIHFETVAEVDPALLDDARLALPASADPPKNEAFDPIRRARDFAQANEPLLRRGAGSPGVELAALEEVLGEWQQAAPSVKSEVDRFGWSRSVWDGYEAAVARRVGLRLSALIARAEQSEGSLEEGREFRSKVLALTRTHGAPGEGASGPIRKQVADFIPRATRLLGTAGGEASDAAEGAATPSTRADAPPAAEEAPRGIIASSRMVWPGKVEAGYHELPREGFSDHRLLPASYFEKALARARWSDEGLSLPLPTVEDEASVSGLQHVTLSSSSVSVDQTTIGAVHSDSSKPHLFKLAGAGEGDDAVVMILAKDAEDRRHCWIYLRAPVEVDVTPEIFFSKPLQDGGAVDRVEGTDGIASSLLASHPATGGVVNSMEIRSSWTGAMEKLGIDLVPALGIAGSLRDLELKTRFRDPADAFEKWFGEGAGGEGSPKAPPLADGWFRGGTRWSEEGGSVSAGTSPILAEETGRRTLRDFLLDPKGKELAKEDAGRLGPRLAAAIILACEAVAPAPATKEEPGPGAASHYLHPKDPVFQLRDRGAKIDLKDLRDRLGQALTGYQFDSVPPKPNEEGGEREKAETEEREESSETPEQRSERLRGEFRSANAQAMKANWTEFNTDLGKILVFAAEVDRLLGSPGGSGGQDAPVLMSQNVLRELKEAESKRRHLESLRDRLRAGELDGVTFRLQVGPGGN